MNVLDAKKIQEEFFLKHKDEIDDIMENIHTMIKRRASIGFSSCTFELVDVGCSLNLKQAVMNRLTQEGFSISYCMNEYTIKW